MALKTYDPDADEKYDSQHLKSAENQAAQDNYDREFNNIAGNYGATAEHPLGAGETGNKSETAASTGKAVDASELKNSEEDADDDMNYAGPSKAKRRFNISKKKAGIAGGVAGSLLGGGLFLASIATGPLQIIHLGQILSRNFSKVESDSSDRTSHLFRYAKAWKNKNVGYTRMGVLGTRVMNGVIDDLAKVGITIETNAANRPTDVKFDRSKLAEEFPETKTMTNDEFKNFLGDKLSVPSSEFKDVVTDKSGKITGFNLDVRSYKFSATQGLIKNGQIGLVGDGKISAAIKVRSVGKFFGLGSLFHPFSRALDQKLNSKITAVQDEKQREAAEKSVIDEENAARTAGVDAQGDVIAGEVKGSVDEQEKGPAGKVIPIIGGIIVAACVTHETAGEIPKLDYYRVVAPSIIQAANVTAMGAQAMNGTGGITMDQVGAAMQNMTDKNGQTIWESPALNSLAGSNIKPDNKGQYKNDLPAEYRQAFEQHSTATTISDASANVLDGLAGPLNILRVVGVDHPGVALCNTVVQYGVAAATTIGQLIAAFATGGASQVVITAADTAESLAVQTFVVGSAIHWIQDWFINSSTGGKLAADAFSGPLGGNLLSFGARATGDLAAIGSGGVSLGNESSTMVAYQDNLDKQQFQSESFFARMFDAKDYHSLTGKLADSVSPSLFGNITLGINNFLNIGSSLTSMFSSWLPHSSAATTNWSGGYNWGFPQYGIPTSLLNEDDLADPYANANTVGQTLSKVCVDQDGNIGPDKGDCASGGPGGDGITGRIMACFGNTLTYDGSMWDVAPTSNVSVDPNDEPYTTHDCGDLTDQSWKQIIMYVNDTATMKTDACYANDDEQSCIDEGLNSGTSTDTSTSSDSGISGDAATLAKQVLANTNITLSSSAKADLQAAADGQKITPGPIGDGSSGLPGCSARTPTDLNPELLKTMLAIAQKYQYQINDIVSGHDCDTGKHPVGRAMDIFYIGGKPLNDSWWSSSSNIDTVNDIGNIVHNTDSYQFGFGVGCTATSKILSRGNLVVFNDSCNPQDEIHIDVRGAP